MAFNKRTWVDGEVVDAADLNTLEDRLAEGLETVPIEVTDPLVAGVLADDTGDSTAQLRTRIEGWVADGTIPAGEAAALTVTETSAGAYSLESGDTQATIYGLTSEQKLPAPAQSQIAADLADPSTPTGAVLDTKADRATALTVNEGPLNLKRYAEDRPGMTMAAAFQQALNALDTASSNDRGGEAYLDKGWYYLDAPLEVGQYTVLRGAGRNATTLLPADGFPLDKPLIRGGKTGVNGALFGQRVENLSVNCRDFLPVGIYSERWNEKSGLRDVSVENFTRYGVHVALVTGEIAQGYDIHTLESTLSQSAENNAVGVYLKASPRVFDNATINVKSGAFKLTGAQRGVVLDNFTGDARNLHWENVPTGLVVGETGACAGFTVHNVTGQATVNTNVVITGGLSSTGYVLTQIKANGSPTNLVDNVNGRTVTDPRINVWQSAAGTTGQQHFFTDIPGIVSRLLGLDVRGVLRALRVNLTDSALELQRTAESFPRFRVLTDGKMQWGAGSAAPDSELYLFSPKRLRTNAAVTTSEFLESQSATGGIILAKPDGSRVRITVDNANALVITPI